MHLTIANVNDFIQFGRVADFSVSMVVMWWTICFVDKSHAPQMKTLKVPRDGANVCTELELTRYLHLLVYWSMSYFLWSKLSLIPWHQQRLVRPFEVQCFIRMILTKIIIVFKKYHKRFKIGGLLDELVGELQTNICLSMALLRPASDRIFYCTITPMITHCLLSAIEGWTENCWSMS